MPPTPDLLACSDRVTDETLSALRDELLPVAEAERLRTHAARCPACQTRLSQYDELRRALLAQPELDPGERIVAGVRVRLDGRRPGVLRRLRVYGMTPASRRWSGLGALAAAAAVLLLFVYVLGTHPGRQLTSAKATPSATATMTPAPSPTATPPLSPVTDIATAWGPNAAVATLTPTDGTKYFITTAITPDGRSLLGQESPSPVGTPAGPDLSGSFDIASRQFHALFRGTQASPVQCCQTDGRFAVAYDYDQPGATCGVCHIRYWAYDFQTGQAAQIAQGGGTYQRILSAKLSEGMFLLDTGIGFFVVNLATRVVTRESGLPANSNSAVLAFSWPYLAYLDQSGNVPALHVRDLATNRDVVLHRFDALVSNAWNGGDGVFVGDTLFMSVSSDPDASGMLHLTTLYELDHAMIPGSPLRTIARAGEDLGGLMGANGRLVLFQSGAWDRAEGRFVEFSQHGAGSPTPLSGSYFALYEATSAGGPQQVTVFDTNRLSVRTGK